MALSSGKALLMRGGCRVWASINAATCASWLPLGLMMTRLRWGPSPSRPRSLLQQVEQASTGRDAGQGRGEAVGYGLDSGGQEATQQGQQAQNCRGYWRSVRVEWQAAPGSPAMPAARLLAIKLKSVLPQSTHMLRRSLMQATLPLTSEPASCTHLQPVGSSPEISRQQEHPGGQSC
jgi:hypothetical protein